MADRLRSWSAGVLLGYVIVQLRRIGRFGRGRRPAHAPAARPAIHCDPAPYSARDRAVHSPTNRFGWPDAFDPGRRRETSRPDGDRAQRARRWRSCRATRPTSTSPGPRASSSAKASTRSWRWRSSPAKSAVLCGIDEAKNLLAHVLGDSDPAETSVEALDDGDPIEPKEIVLRIRARYRRFGLYETAFLGMLAQSTGWATAARAGRRSRRAAAGHQLRRPPRPSRTSPTSSTTPRSSAAASAPRRPAGARLAGLSPTGTMPHSLVLVFGDTVRAAEAFDRDLGPDVSRIVLVDTFKDEAEEALRVAHALGDRLYGIRLDTPSERGRVTADLVKEVRARLDLEGFQHVKIVDLGRPDPRADHLLPGAGRPGRLVRGRQLHQRRHADRLHRRHQGARRPADRQARPDPGADRQPSPATGRSRRLAGRRRLSRSGPEARRRPRGGRPSSSPTIDFASQISPRSMAARASAKGIRTSSRRSSSSGPRRSPWAGREVGRQVQVHQLAGEAGRRPEGGQLAPAAGPVAGLLLELARCGPARDPRSSRQRVDDVERPGRDLEHQPAGGRPPLADEEDVAVRVDRRRSRPPRDGRGSRGSTSAHR